MVVAHIGHVERNGIAAAQKVLVRGHVLRRNVLAVAQRQILLGPLISQLLLAIAFTDATERWHFVLGQHVEVLFDLRSGQNHPN